MDIFPGLLWRNDQALGEASKANSETAVSYAKLASSRREVELVLLQQIREADG